MIGTNIESFEQNSFKPVYDSPEKMEMLNKAFKTSVKPENGAYGITEMLKDNGVMERISRNEFGHIKKEYFQDGKLQFIREKIDDNAWRKSVLDDNGKEYLREITRKGSNGVIVNRRTELLPDLEIHKNNFVAVTDSKGRLIHNKMTDITISPGRKSLSEHLKNVDYREGDQRGHLIPDIFEGPNTVDNIVPQTSTVNQKYIKEVENRARRFKEEGHKVDYEVKVNYDNDGTRPSSFEPKITCDGKEVSLPKELKKIFNDDFSTGEKLVTSAKEHLNSAKTALSPMHRKGVEEGLEAATLTLAISTVDNVADFISGEISAEEAAMNIAKETGASAVVGYGTGFATAVVSKAMGKSSSELIKNLGREAGVPSALVSFGVESYSTVMDFAQGKIDTSELAYDLGENAANVAGGALGTALASAALGSVVPGAGTVVGFAAGFVGSMVGCAVAAGAYETAVETGAKGVDVLAEKTQEMADRTVEYAQEYVPDQVETVKGALNDFAAEHHLPFSV